MPLYRCTKCDVVDNTATGGYWEQQLAAVKSDKPFKPLCSQCHTGKWHGSFERKGITGDWWQDGSGFVYRPTEIAKFQHLGPFNPVVL